MPIINNLAGGEVEITKLADILSGTDYDITDVYYADKHVFTVWDTSEGALPLTFSANGDNAVDWKVWGNVADGANLFPPDVVWYRNNNTDPNNHADSQSGRIKSDIFPISYTTTNIRVAMFNPPSISDFTLVSIRFYSPTMDYLGNSTTTIPENAAYASLLYGSDSGQIDADTKTDLANAKITVTNSSTAPSTYTPYSDSDRVGQRTGNLFDKDAHDVDNGYIKDYALNNNGSTSTLPAYHDRIWTSEYIDIAPNETYTFSHLFPGTYVGACWYDENKTYINGVAYGIPAADRTITMPSNARYVRMTGINDSNYDIPMLTLGSTAPASYIPYGYEIPMAVGDGNTNETVNLYIGSTPLDSGEYTSYKDQKIYKYVNGTLTPTDPPVPIPALPTLDGVTVVDSELDQTAVQPEQASVKFRKMNS